MQSPTSTNSDGDSIKKFDLFLLLFDLYELFKENWKLVSSILVIISWLILRAYFNHFNRLDLFIELVTDNKLNLIFIIFPFILICLSLLIILNITGWLCVIYLNLINFKHDEYRNKYLVILIPVCASFFPIFIFLSVSYFFNIKENYQLYFFLGGLFVTFIICVAIYVINIKFNESIKLEKKVACFLCLFLLPFIVFLSTGRTLIFRFFVGMSTFCDILLISLIILVFIAIFITPLYLYITNIEENKLLDPRDSINKTIKNSFWASIVSLVLVFILLNKVFVFSSYATLRLLGVVDLNSVYEFSLVKNDVTVMKLAENEWKFDYEFNDQISLKGNIGFHLGDIYLICEEGTKEIFMESLRYDFAKQEIKPIDNKTCIPFKKDEINVIQIKVQNNNEQSTEE